MTINMSLPNELNHIKWSQYGWVLAGIFVATLIRFPVQPLIHDITPFLFYLPVVIAVAIAFGQRLGLLATVLSVLPANYFWMPPANAFEINWSDAWHVLDFSVAGFSVSWLSEAGRRRKQLQEHLRATLASVGDAIVTTDCCGRIVYLNSMAEVLTGLDGLESRGSMLGSALVLLAEDGRLVLSGTFQAAVNNDDIESLPRRLIVCSKTGGQSRVEQKTSRILDPSGRKLGIAILLHQVELNPDGCPRRDPAKNVDPLNATSSLPRIAMICVHGSLTARPAGDAPATGGLAAYVLGLSQRLAPMGYEVDIWTRRLEGQPEIETVDAQIRIIRLMCGGGDFISPDRLFECLPEWNENALEFIRAHGLKYEFLNSHYWDGGLAARHLSRMLGVPHFHSPHSLGVWKKRQAEAHAPNTLANAEAEPGFTKRIVSERSIYATADLIVATSPQQQEVLFRDYGLSPEKCRLIPPGYDENRFFPVSDSARRTIRRRLGFRTPVIQAVASLADHQSCELLVRAFAVISHEMSEAILQLLVDRKALTPHEASVFIRLRALIGELGLARKIAFESAIPDQQRADYYRAADLFILAGWEDSAPMAALQAMACGTPTLPITYGLLQAADAGQNDLDADLCRDPAVLGNAILKIIKDPEARLQLSLQGTRLARSGFTWAGIAQEFIMLARIKNDRAQAQSESCSAVDGGPTHDSAS